ncbi:Alpha-crystallin, subunit A [Parasponia andersonii]|uniref:Calcyclin-binding protein n=1 Tax=Parasponia andersonii TaxID=3476 RepID=A0A2P5DH49_PARAD|nr:Alpha-crystallin, subunit A [Parasponia andersonii]
MADDYALDLEELRHFQSIAKRPRVLNLISSEIRNLEKLSKEAVTPPTSHAPTPISTAVKLSNEAVTPPTSQAPTPISTAVKVPSTPAVSYITLGSFSWEQDNDKVKLYISLEGVDQEKVEADFKPMSFDIKFHDVQGKNYRCAIPKLNKDIVPEKCKVLVKPTRAVLTLIKASKGNWLDLYYKEDKLKPTLDKERDPMAGIMDMMKNMYEEGDDEMKRTIAKAWTDARSGKTTDPLKGFN